MRKSKGYKFIVGFISWIIAIPINIVLLPYCLFIEIMKHPKEANMKPHYRTGGIKVKERGGK